MQEITLSRGSSVAVTDLTALTAKSFRHLPTAEDVHYATEPDHQRKERATSEEQTETKPPEALHTGELSSAFSVRSTNPITKRTVTLESGDHQKHVLVHLEYHSAHNKCNIVSAGRVRTGSPGVGLATAIPIASTIFVGPQNSEGQLACRRRSEHRVSDQIWQGSGN